MKKISTLIIIFLAGLHLQGISQFVKASIGTGSQVNRAIIYMKPDQTQASASLSTLQFNVGVDTTGLLTPPVLTVVNSAFGATVWTVNPGYNEGGFWNYNCHTIVKT